MSDRTALALGSLEIRWYGVFVALGFIAGMLLMQWRARKTNYAVGQIPDLVVLAIVGGLLGARLFYVITFWSYFRQHPGQIIRIDQGGLVFYGGFFCAALTLVIYCRMRKLDPWRIADIVAFGLPVGQAFGRIGCFINGCCFGRPIGGPLGVTYLKPPHDIIFEIQLAKGQIHPGNIDQLIHPGSTVHSCLPVAPVQLSQGLTNLLVFGIILWLSTKVKRPGLLFAAYLVFYAIGRFLNEFNRGDYEHLRAGLTNAQVICLILLPVGIIMYLYRRRAPLPEKDVAAA